MSIRGSRLARRVAYCMLGVVCATPATLALAATPVSAYERINEHCILRAYEPIAFGEGNFTYAGEVDCRSYKDVWMEIEVCAEVQNTVNGQWY